MSTNYSLERDLNEAAAMADSLTPYIHENALYGATAGGGLFNTMPSLTLGALLMRLRRLTVLRDSLSGKQQSKLDDALARDEEIFRTWRNYYEAKLVREAHSRLDAMSTFFEECAQNPTGCPGIYGPEASRRTIVEELLLAMKTRNVAQTDIDDVTGKASGVDSRLRAVTRPQPFIWDDTLTPVYPQGTFWWLYASPVAPGK